MTEVCPAVGERYCGTQDWSLGGEGIATTVASVTGLPFCQGFNAEGHLVSGLALVLCMGLAWNLLRLPNSS